MLKLCLVVLPGRCSWQCLLQRYRVQWQWLFVSLLHASYTCVLLLQAVLNNMNKEATFKTSSSFVLTLVCCLILSTVITLWVRLIFWVYSDPLVLLIVLLLRYLIDVLGCWLPILMSGFSRLSDILMLFPWLVGPLDCVIIGLRPYYSGDILVNAWAKPSEESFDLFLLCVN